MKNSILFTADGQRSFIINLDMITYIRKTGGDGLEIHIGDTVINIDNGKSFLRLVKEVHPDLKWLIDEPR